MMTAATSGPAASFGAALNSFAMEFGVVPNGVDGSTVLFDTVGKPQAGLQPLINTDGAWEDTRRISGFPPIIGRGEDADGVFDDGNLSTFHRDWLHISEMMNRPLRALVLGLDLMPERDGGISEGLVPRDDSGWFEVEEKILPSRELSEPDMKGMELMTVRDMLGMIGNGSVRMERVREIGAYLYASGLKEERRDFSANLFLAAGLLAAKIGEGKLATMSVERAAARVPDECDVGRAMLYEIAADINETPSGRVATARKWLRSMITDRDLESIGIRSLHALWNAWRVGDLALMMEIMSIYMIIQHDMKERAEAARSLVRMAWLESERMRGNGEGDAPDLAQTGIYTYLDIATSLFIRIGDGTNAGRTHELVDMLIPGTRGNSVA
jgi:hypothetical protein